MSTPVLINSQYTPHNSVYAKTRTTAALDLGTGDGRAVIVVACVTGNSGTWAWDSATVGGVAMTAGGTGYDASNGVNGAHSRVFYLASGVPTGSQTVTVNASDPGQPDRPMYVMVYVFQDQAVTGASISLTPTTPAMTQVSGGANSYTVPGTGTSGSLAFLSAISFGLSGAAQATYTGGTSSLYFSNSTSQVEAMGKAGNGGSVVLNWQTAGGVSTPYQSYGFVINGSAPAVLTITTQPSAQSVTTGATATFSVTASAGTTPYTYQWRRNGVNIPSATASSYTTPATTITGGSANNGDVYSVVVTDSVLSTTTSSNATLTVTAGPATAVTASGPGGGTVLVASTNFTVGANGTITGTVVVTPSDGGGGGTFTPTTVSISSGSPVATFTYTPSTAGAKTISFTNNGGLTNPANLTYTASLTSGTLTSSVLKNNTGSILTSVAFEAYVSNPTTGALIVKKTGLTSNAISGVISFSDAAVVATSTYRVVWKAVVSGAEGLETLTAS